jgi:hypothetical protein
MENSTDAAITAECFATCTVCLDEMPRDITTVVAGDVACHSCLRDKFCEALVFEALWPVK